MKGIHGLILAVGLGIAGALLNFMYLSSESRKMVMVDFVGIAPGKTIPRGERLLAEHVVPVKIPAQAVGNLKDFAFGYEARTTVIGQRVWRTMTAGSLVLQQDIKNPPTQFNFGANQELAQGEEVRAVGVPIDPRKMISALVNPGDLVTFMVAGGGDAPTVAPPRPKPASKPDVNPDGDLGEGAKPEADATASPIVLSGAEGLEMVGPFEVLTVGNRLGSPEVMQAAQMPQLQENVMTILIRLKDGKLESEAAKLMRLIEATNSRPLAYMLHPRKPKSE